MEAWQELAFGIILMVVLGPAVGNYATSFVYRLPRGQSPFEKHPYCGGCNTFLKAEDLFPIWSYVLLKGRCQYCQMKIPAVYTWVEVACGALFVGNYLVWGISESFIILTLLGVFWITLAALEHQQRKLYPVVLAQMVALAFIYGALMRASIYPSFMSAVVMMFVLVVVWRVLVWRGAASATQIPGWLWLGGLLGVMLPLEQAAIAMAASAVIALICRRVMGNACWAGATWLVLFGWLWLERSPFWPM